MKRLILIALFSLIMTAPLTQAGPAESKKRVLVVGWDGADWDLIEPLLKRDKLPHLKRIMESGDFSSLESSTPSMSPVAWTTFATGKNPGKHGIFSFLRKRDEEFIPLTGDNVRAKRIWDYTSDQNLTSIVINVPMTYPPYELKGKLISGYLSLENTTYTYPQNLQEKIEAGGIR